MRENGSDRYILRRLSLPCDSRLPSDSEPRSRRSGRRSVETVEFDSPFVRPVGPEEARAWNHWCGGHQHLFLYWVFMADSARHAADALRDEETEPAIVHLNRFQKLLMGSLSVMLCATDFSTEIYNSLIRPSMVCAREDFSGISSREYAELISQFEGMRAEIKRFDESGRGETALELGRAVESARACWPLWFQEHHRIARRFDPEGASLLELALKRMERKGMAVDKKRYAAEVLRSPEARKAQDVYFGVDRTCERLDSLEATVRRTIAATRRHFASGLTPAERQRLRDGDAVLEEILKERCGSGVEAQAA